MARDPLIVLARLRALQRDTARRDMAAAQGALVSAESRAERVERALSREASAAVADYAAWLPAAQAARENAARGVAQAETSATVARDDLVAARAAAEAVDHLIAARRAERRQARFARDQAAMDDVRRLT